MMMFLPWYMWYLTLSVHLHDTIDPSQSPTPLLLRPTSHGALTTHTMFSRSEKYIAEQRGHWQHADRQDRAGYIWYESLWKYENKTEQSKNQTKTNKKNFQNDV